MTTTQTSPPLRVAPADPADAARYFARRLAFHTDVSDVHTAMESGDPGFVLVDSRGADGWEQGHVPGAIHVPHAEIAERVAGFDPAVPVVTYCWGPACDGGTRAAFAFAERGFRVKEMLGGIEYWIREGFAVESAAGPIRHERDPLTGPSGAVSCDC